MKSSLLVILLSSVIAIENGAVVVASEEIVSSNTPATPPVHVGTFAGGRSTASKKKNRNRNRIPKLLVFEVRGDKGIYNVISKSIPAHIVGSSSNNNDSNDNNGSYRKVVEVSTTTTTTSRKPRILSSLSSIPMIPNVGVYYGIDPEKAFDTSQQQPRPTKAKRVTMADTMTETLVELRNMREELQALRQEMKEMQRKLTGEEPPEDEATVLAKRAKRQREFQEMGRDVEAWGRRILFEEERNGDGWEEVNCGGLAKRSFNREGKTTAYIKWMKDPRGKHADPTDEREYPCIKMFSSIDAPMEEVCAYLSRQENLPQYNDLVIEHDDIEEISPQSKITWGKTPQILFVKSREFVTFCSHRFCKDGAQVVVNQAVEHVKFPPCHEDKGNNICRAYALRGVNFIMRDPDDPERTQMALIAHCNPGGGLPQWAVKTCINALAPIEPFKLFHKINANVVGKRPQLQQQLEHIEVVSMRNGSPKRRPAGLSQLGYACFWPEGAPTSRGMEQQQQQTGGEDHHQQQQTTLRAEEQGGGNNNVVASGQTQQSTPL